MVIFQMGALDANGAISGKWSNENTMPVNDSMQFDLELVDAEKDRHHPTAGGEYSYIGSFDVYNEENGNTERLFETWVTLRFTMKENGWLITGRGNNVSGGDYYIRGWVTNEHKVYMTKWFVDQFSDDEEEEATKKRVGGKAKRSHPKMNMREEIWNPMILSLMKEGQKPMKIVRKERDHP